MPMTPGEIKEALKENGLSFAAVGRRMRPTVSRVSVSRSAHQIQGCKSARIENAIARAIGRDRDEVFGNAAAA